MFKYLGRLLDWSENKLPAVLCNIKKARQAWGRHRKLLSREGAEPEVLEKFLRAVVQAVLLFGAETWVLTEPMMQRLEGAHVSFLCRITHK